MSGGRDWTQEELDAVVDLYPEGGWDAVNARFPHRGRVAIQQRAALLGVKLLVRRKRGYYAAIADTSPKRKSPSPGYPWPPLSDLDRLGMKLWGFAANTDQPLRPMVRVELEAAA